MNATWPFAAGLPKPLIGFGEVRHTRVRPAHNHFVYPTYFLMLPMRALREAPHPDLARNRFAAISFSDSDHGDGRADSLAWLEGLWIVVTPSARSCSKAQFCCGIRSPTP